GTSGYHTLDSAASPAAASPDIVPASAAQPAQESGAPKSQGRRLPSVAGLLIILQDSPDTPQRQWASEMLALVDWTDHGEVVPALLAAARRDSAAVVRIQCIRTLTVHNVNTPAVLAAFQELQTDPDPRIQQEATEGLVRLNANPPTTATSSGEFAAE